MLSARPRCPLSVSFCGLRAAPGAPAAEGITLTAADVAIIFDSDWNPQADLQAMARCHRIGQTKSVRVYRLVTRGTAEESLLRTANKKIGLEEALLGSSSGGDGDESEPKDLACIERLLNHGALALGIARRPGDDGGEL